MQFKVPQNLDLQDKIVGPLTMVQFLYLLFGGMIVYVLFTTLKTSWLFYITAIPIALFAVALTFLKVQEQPLSHFVKAAFIFFTSPRSRLWHRTPLVHHVITDQGRPVKKEEVQVQKKVVEKSQLDQLAYILDTETPKEQEAKSFGKVTNVYEDMIKKGHFANVVKSLTPNKNQQGGDSATVGQ